MTAPNQPSWWSCHRRMVTAAGMAVALIVTALALALRPTSTQRQLTAAAEPSADVPTATSAAPPQRKRAAKARARAPRPQSTTSTRRAARPAPTTTARLRGPWRLVWSDEFEGNSINKSKWDIENYSTYGDGNQELACLMDRPQNITARDGTAIFTGRHENPAFRCGKDSRFPDGRTYTSAMMHTKGKAEFTYGRFEMRAKLPIQPNTSKGMWPAFWLRPVDGGTGELDIMEAIGSSGNSKEPTSIHQTIHYDYQRTHSPMKHTYRTPGWLPSDGFHTYAVEWKPGSITWLVDDKVTYVTNRGTTPWLDEAFAGNKKFFIRLNLAIGGKWPGSPDAATAFPSQYQVDYVRVYQRK